MDTDEMSNKTTTQSRRKRLATVPRGLASLPQVHREDVDDELEPGWANDVRSLNDLSVEQRALLVSWIREAFVPAYHMFHRTSDSLRHYPDRERPGFSVTNGMFKGAMLAAGFRPVDAREVNWRFRVRPALDLTAHERKRMRVIGRRTTGREWSGYLVANRANRRRIDAWCNACAMEKRPVVRVEVQGRTADVIMDMTTADWRLSSPASNAVARLFMSLDPTGTNWRDVNECYNYIRDMPRALAGRIAATLVGIAEGCRPQKARQLPDLAPTDQKICTCCSSVA
jgi:hypothetical protein